MDKKYFKWLNAEFFIWLAVLFGIFVLGLVVLDTLVMPWYTKHGESLAVPNVVGNRYEVAKDLLESDDLEVIKAGEKYDSTLPFGYVVEQNPLPNRLVKKGRRIYLTISVGERDIEMPELVGLSETNAQETLKSVGLRLGDVEYEYISSELPGVVIAQSFDAKTLVKANTAVNITVSLGKPTAKVVVPSVLGKTLDIAKREIQKAGLTLGDVSYKTNNEFLPNTVIEQSLDSGITVAHGKKIDLLVTTVVAQGGNP